MPLEMEHRPSDSPYVARVWRCRSDDVAQMTSVATPRLGLAFWEQQGQVHVAVTGPESKASPAPVPTYATFFGIDFALGTTLPHLPVAGLLDKQLEVPGATRRTFQLAGSGWRVPDYDNAETFVRQLVREGVLIRDPVVAEAARGATSSASERTVQRRFLAATGLTPGAVRQIDRARRAALLLQDGVPTADLVNLLGYYDQPHLARSLSRYIGRTTTRLRNGDPGEPLSLLYKT